MLTPQRMAFGAAMASVGTACLLTTSFDDLSGGSDPSEDARVESERLDVGVDGNADGREARSYRDEVLADQPVAYYRLGESTLPGARDEISGSSSGAYAGDVTLGATGALAADPDTAASFGGTGKIDLGDAFKYFGNQPCSFEAWVAPAPSPTDSNVMSKMDSNNARGWLLYVVGDSDELVLFRNDQTTGNAQLSTAGLQRDAYQHVVFTYGADGLKLYIQGILRTADPTTRSMGAVVNPLVIGFNASNGCCNFKGTIDEVAIYDRALTPERVLVHYLRGTGQ